MDPDGPEQNVHQYLLASAFLFPNTTHMRGDAKSWIACRFLEGWRWNDSTALMCTASKQAVDAAVAVDRKARVCPRGHRWWVKQSAWN